MKYCPDCGTAVEDAGKFCSRCGHAFPVAPVFDADGAQTPVAEPFFAPEASDWTAQPDGMPPVDCPAVQAEETADDAQSDAAADAPSPFVMEAPAPGSAPAPAPAPVPAAKPRKELLSTIQYILLIILFAIPVVGLVCLFVFGCGNPKNTSLKRFSLAVLILTLIAWILIIAAAIVCYVAYADVIPGIVDSIRDWLFTAGLSF